MSAKTFSVCPEAKQPTIHVNTYGDIETFTFRRKAQADKRIMELLRAGYTFDATHETTQEAPTPTAHLCTCPRCGRPAQRETTPHGESYITCGHCSQITFDSTGETMDQVVERALDLCGVPLPDEERYGHTLTSPPTPARVSWNSRHAPMPPIEALRLVLTLGVTEETRPLLLASLEAADRKALDDAEQLTAARNSVAVNLEMRKIEAALFDLPC